MIGEYVKLSGVMELIAKLKADERLMKNKDAKEGIEEMALLLQVSLHFTAVFLVARTQLYKSVGRFRPSGVIFGRPKMSCSNLTGEDQSAGRDQTASNLWSCIRTCYCAVICPVSC